LAGCSQEDVRQEEEASKRLAEVTRDHFAPSPAEIARIKRARAAGVTIKDLVKRFNLPQPTIRKLLADELRKS
jgi:hypothetical protein